ncbi:MAG TPA: hypothetical protein VF472_19890 [Burkholderiaceae bacterium]
MSNRSFTCSLIASLFALAVAGSAAAEDSKPALQAPNDGAVLLRVLSNKPEMILIYFAKAWDALTIEREADSSGAPATYTLQVIADGSTSRSAIFAAALPPGHYRLEKFRRNNAWLTVNEKFSRFDIESGKLTDLGVIVESEGLDNTGKEMLSHSQPGDMEETKTLVRELTPDLRKLLGNPTLGWRADSVPSNMAEMSNYSLLHSVGFASHQETAEGDLVFAGDNGAVMRWNSRKGWTVYDVGQRSAVGALLVASNGDWVAGGELGMLKSSSDQGLTWRSLRGNIPYGITLDLSEWNGRVVATIMHGGEIQIYSAPLRSSDWQLLAQYTSSISRFFDYRAVRPQSLLHGDHLITFVPGRKVAVLDLAQGSNEQYDMPGSCSGISMMPDGSLEAGCIVMVMNPYVSRDDGKTWSSSPFPRMSRIPAFSDDKHGFSLRHVAFSSSPEFTYTEDGGKTWTDSPQRAEPGLWSMFWSHDGKTAYAINETGTILQSQDEAKTWLRAQ